MKYRLTLMKEKNNILLSVTEGMEFKNASGIITSQMAEDFMGPSYFLNNLNSKLQTISGTLRHSKMKWMWKETDGLIPCIIVILNTICSPLRYGRVGSSYTDLIGNTPLFHLKRLGSMCHAEILVKLECMEPNSVKDRPVFQIIKSAIERGEINDETEVVEASSGNVAFALSAILQSLKNKKPKIFISKMHGDTKINMVRMSGCPVYLTNAEEGTKSAKKESILYAESHDHIFQLNQHGNPDNYKAHQMTTGPELFHQAHLLTGHPPAEFVTGIGSGGTAVGIAKFRSEIGSDFKIVGVEPKGSSLNSGGAFKAHSYSGIAPGFITDIISQNRHEIDHIETVTKEEGFDMCRRMLIEEGLLVGATSGASIAAAVKRANLPENKGKTIVTIAHDRGDRYMEVKDLFIPPETATSVDLDG